jgi:hypothetical protein
MVLAAERLPIEEELLGRVEGAVLHHLDSGCLR